MLPHRSPQIASLNRSPFLLSSSSSSPQIAPLAASVASSLKSRAQLPPLWREADEKLMRLCYKAMGLSERSALATCLQASEIALPTALKYMAVLKKGNNNSILNGQEQPVEVDLGKELQFHSTFICPIAKTPATSENVPVLLKCGHVISTEAMDRIVRLSRFNRFKCPTCPKEQTPAETVPLAL